MKFSVYNNVESGRCVAFDLCTSQTTKRQRLKMRKVLTKDQDRSLRHIRTPVKRTDPAMSLTRRMKKNRMMLAMMVYMTKIAPHRSRT